LFTEPEKNLNITVCAKRFRLSQQGLTEYREIMIVAKERCSHLERLPVALHGLGQMKQTLPQVPCCSQVEPESNASR
jgi:hypothetical protein